LESICNKVKPQQNDDSMLERLRRIVQVEEITQEINDYFRDIQSAYEDCSVCRIFLSNSV